MTGPCLQTMRCRCGRRRCFRRVTTAVSDGFKEETHEDWFNSIQKAFEHHGNPRYRQKSTNRPEGHFELVGLCGICILQFEIIPCLCFRPTSFMDWSSHAA
eukprot:scaffold174446_cov24-Attheya_sp.AAC.1